jgi:hypothetical protein
MTVVLSSIFYFCVILYLMAIPFLAAARALGWISVEWRTLFAPFHVAGVFIGMIVFVGTVMLMFMTILHWFGIIQLWS